MKPDYSNSHFATENLKRGNLKVVKVEDLRTVKGKYAGSVETGFFSNTPFVLDCDVSEFVQQSVNELITEDASSISVTPVEVTIDKFELSEFPGTLNEEGIFSLSLTFKYPISKDSMAAIPVESLKSGKIGKDEPNNLIYLGMLDCVSQFIRSFDEKEFIALDANKLPSSRERAEVQTEPSSKTTINKIKVSPHRNNFQHRYYKGNAINLGVGLGWHLFPYVGHKQFIYGFGAVLNYYDIEDTDEIRNSYFFGAGLSINGKYYLSQSQQGLFFDGALKLSMGSEELVDAEGEVVTSNFFIGPTFEASVGYQFGSVYFDAGAYALKHWNAEVLPDDIGLFIGFGLMLK